MKTYRFEVDELVEVWNRQTVQIEAESKEEILEHIKKGDLFSFYDVEYDDYEIIHDTMKNIDWDYSLVEEEDIREQI